MSTVKIINENSFPYEENYKGSKIKIEPGKHIVMEQYDAIQFLGTMPPGGVKVDHDGRPDVRYLKKLKMEVMDGVELHSHQTGKPIDDILSCHKCKYIAQSAEDMDEHITLNHLSDMADKDEVTKRKR